MPPRKLSVRRSSSKKGGPHRRRQKSLEYRPRSRSKSVPKNSSSSRSHSKKRDSAALQASRPRSRRSSTSIISDALDDVVCQRRPDLRYAPRNNDYTSPKALERLRHYHGTTEDHSILSGLLQPFWNTTTRCLPTWISPNVLTVSGFFIGLTGPLLVLFNLAKEGSLSSGILGGWNSSSSGENAIGKRDESIFSSWVWFWSAFALFMYMTLDAVDGKQARRLHAVSPLGELLDHGLDACMTFFVHINLSIALCMPPWMAFLFSFEAMTGLFTCIWEQYSTGTFSLGYISAPTEGIAAAIAQFLITGIYGREFWSWAPLGTVSVPLPFFAVQFVKNLFQFTEKTMATKMKVGNHTQDLDFVFIGSLRSITLLVFTFGWILTVMMNICHVCSRAKNHRGHFITLLVMMVPCVCHVCLYALFPTMHNVVFPLFEMTFGLLIAVSAVKMCIARLTQTVYKSYHPYFLTFLVLHFGLFAAHTLHLFHPVSPYVEIWAGLVVLSGALSYTCLMISFPLHVKKYFNLDIFVLSKNYHLR